MWFDIESGELIAEWDLRREYEEARRNDPDNEAGYRDMTFEEYIKVSETSENGTLIRVLTVETRTL